MQERLGSESAGFIKVRLQELKRLKQERDDKEAQGVELSFYLYDHLGTPNALVDRQGNNIWAATLDAWGNVREEPDVRNTSSNPGRLVSGACPCGKTGIRA